MPAVDNLYEAMLAGWAQRGIVVAQQPHLVVGIIAGFIWPGINQHGLFGAQGDAVGRGAAREQGLHRSLAHKAARAKEDPVAVRIFRCVIGVCRGGMPRKCAFHEFCSST